MLHPNCIELDSSTRRLLERLERWKALGPRHFLYLNFVTGLLLTTFFSVLNLALDRDFESLAGIITGGMIGSSIAALLGWRYFLPRQIKRIREGKVKADPSAVLEATGIAALSGILGTIASVAALRNVQSGLPPQPWVFMPAIAGAVLVFWAICIIVRYQRREGRHWPTPKLYLVVFGLLCPLLLTLNSFPMVVRYLYFKQFFP